MLDRNNQHIRLIYGEDGYPSQIIDSVGRSFKLEFESIKLSNSTTSPISLGSVLAGRGKATDFVNRLTRVSLAGEQLVRYGYSEQGDLTSVYDSQDQCLRNFGYNNHILVLHAQPDGLVSQYEYDQYSIKGKVKRNWTNLDEQWLFDYQLGQTVITNPLGDSEVIGYDHNQEIIFEIDPLGNKTLIERNGYAQIYKQTDPLGRTNSFYYDIRGNLIRSLDAAGTATDISYHASIRGLPMVVS